MSLVVSGANKHDLKLLEPTLDNVVVKQPSKKNKAKQHLCGDKGYDAESARQAIVKRGYVPHIRSRGEEAKTLKQSPRRKPRRWVVERTLSWLNRFRKILVRFEKKAASHQGLMELACSFIVFRQVIVIYG